MQSYTRLEIIVVDDGSTDSTAKVAQEHADVHYIRQNNQGLSAARNTGLRHSRGEYLVFLDADDRLLPGAVTAGLQALSMNPACAFVSGHHYYIQADGSFLSRYVQKKVGDDAYATLLRGNYIRMHATVLYRRAIFTSVGGFDTSLDACEDYDLYLRIARRFPVCQHTEVVAEYRMHINNMSHNSALMLRTVLRVLRSQWQYVQPEKNYVEAYRAGIRFYRQYYSEEMFKQVARKPLPVKIVGLAGAAKTGLRYAPGPFVKGSGRLMLEMTTQRLKTLLPLWLCHYLVRWKTGDYHPPVGHVRFGDLRRLTPLSREFGYDRGLPIDRYYIEKFLGYHASVIQGRVLEIGDDSYTRRFGGERVHTRDVLNVTDGNPAATIVADLTCAECIPSNTFDCVILTQTLQLIYDLEAAVQTLHRILKPGGVLLATVPGISQISTDQWGASWFWAFTVQAVDRLFASVFSKPSVSVEAHGNVLAATAFLQGLAAEELTPKELDFQDPQYQCLITISAIKS